MGQIASDFFKKYKSAYYMENPFTVEELLRMGSHDIQEEYAGLMDSEESYIPAEVLISLLRDRAFFTNLIAMRDAGEQVVMSNVSIAITSNHVGVEGVSPEDAAENIIAFFEDEEEVSQNIRSTTVGSGARISKLYVFANGWYGVETEQLMDLSWQDKLEEDEAENLPLDDDLYEPSTSYLFSDDGDLIATPDFHDNINAWMLFVEMFSAVHEEASAADEDMLQDIEIDDAAKNYIVFSDEVQHAIDMGKPLVIMESAATFGGMIYPGIYDFAKAMQKTVRDNGACPAFVAIINGVIHIGLTDDEIFYLENKRGSIFKASARDIPILLAKRADGVMTIAAAVSAAAMVGCVVACGSGIGGAQIGAEKSMDISTDLESLASNAVMVICSGTKPILDLNLTMEYLETKGVPVIGYGTDRMPEYMVRGSGFRLTYRMDTPAELAEVMKIKAKMGIPGGVLVVNPVPKEYELDPVKTRMAVGEAMHDVEKNNVQGKAITGYMMGRIREYLGKESMESQKAFLLNNAVLAAKIAVALRGKR